MGGTIISNPAKSRPLRAAGIFILDLLGAVLVPAILESTIWRILPVHTALGIVVKQWCFDVTVAAFMGFMMYRSWRSATSKWAWILPALWFAFRALPYAAHEQGVLSASGGFWAHFSGASCAAQMSNCPDFLVFSVPLIRSVAYSASAWLASRILKPLALNSASDSKITNEKVTSA